jgi:hypothetical protein
MASLTAQMEELQKQQAILAEKIKEEEERNLKLNKEASISRIEALIQPITQYLNRSVEDGVSSGRSKAVTPTMREIFEDERKRFKRAGDLSLLRPRISFLTNEEIFVTLLGIIKKQDARIGELELLSKK